MNELVLFANISADRCPALESRDHVVKSTTNTSAGIVVTLMTENGYRFVDGSGNVAQVSCLATDLTWSDVIPDVEGLNFNCRICWDFILKICQKFSAVVVMFSAVVQCPELNVEYATLSSTNSSYNASVTISCDPGYQLPGDRTAVTVSCLHTGDWSEQLHSCTSA